MSEFRQLTEEILRFRDARDWVQFHSPKHLAAAVSIEAAELQELFLWKSDEEVAVFLQGKGRRRVKEELADILIFSLLLADSVAVDLEAATREKLRENSEKYPVELSKGRAKKYHDLKPE
jgi:NTP pyrophosphatase (non-canonical NTP hydrolase)